MGDSPELSSDLIFQAYFSNIPEIYSFEPAKQLLLK
jgi:hypothetical protein